MEFKQTEINPNMSEKEQLQTKLNNWLVMDAINEHYKNEDLDEYYEYLKDYKAPFNEIGEIKQVKEIFYAVETDNGIVYFERNAGCYEGIWEFDQVTLENVEAVA